MERWLSGRRRQAVNLLVKTLIGSNPVLFNLNSILYKNSMDKNFYNFFNINLIKKNLYTIDDILFENTYKNNYNSNNYIYYNYTLNYFYFFQKMIYLNKFLYSTRSYFYIKFRISKKKINICGFDLKGNLFFTLNHTYILNKVGFKHRNKIKFKFYKEYLPILINLFNYIIKSIPSDYVILLIDNFFFFNNFFFKKFEFKIKHILIKHPNYCISEKNKRKRRIKKNLKKRLIKNIRL